MIASLENCRWMYNQINPNTRTIMEEFMFGVEDFVNYACQFLVYISKGVIQCPCVKCYSEKLWKPEIVIVHLYKIVFKPNYWIWTDYGEEMLDQISVDCVRGDDHPMLQEQEDVASRYQYMVYDAARMDFDNSTRYFEPKEFYDLLNATSQPIQPSYEAHLELLLTIQILGIKCDYNVTHACFDAFMEILT